MSRVIRVAVGMGAFVLFVPFASLALAALYLNPDVEEQWRAVVVAGAAVPYVLSGLWLLYWMTADREGAK